jgi:hypothetical protein
MSHLPDNKLTIAQTDRGVPIDFKVTAPLGAFKHLNHMSFPGHHKPVFVDQGMSPPEWWKHTELMSVFDKIMIDKVCGRPSASVLWLMCSTRNHR